MKFEKSNKNEIRTTGKMERGQKRNSQKPNQAERERRNLKKTQT